MLWLRRFFGRLVRGVLGTRRVDLFRRWQLARTDGYPNWGRILDRPRWDAARAEAKDGPKVLLATSVGSVLQAAALDGLLGAALTLRRARPHAFLCDAALPACFESGARWHADTSRLDGASLTAGLCSNCTWPAARMFESLDMPVHRYGACLTPEDVRRADEISESVPLPEIRAFKLDGVAVGEHAWAGAVRFYGRGTLDDEPCGEHVFRSYFKAALRTAMAAGRLLDRERFDCVVVHHCIYVPQGLIGEAARRRGIRVVAWNTAYRRSTFVFSHGDTYHHTLMDEPVANWESLPWTPALEEQIMRYLKSRWTGTRDWISFQKTPEVDVDAIRKELGIDFAKPTIGMLTNVFWDAQLHYPANAFPNMMDWVLKTVAWFAKRPDLQLLIRAHPAELHGSIPSRQPVAGEIRKAFPTLPPNVFIAGPESKISTYAAMLQCDSVIIYGTKTGVEVTSLGLPTIVAGEAWIRNKGLTLDAMSELHYFELLGRLPLRQRMPEEQVQRARKYAYHFFFRRMIPVRPIEPTAVLPVCRIREGSFGDMGPGGCPGLDVICRGILEGTEFIYPAERYAEPVELS